MALLYGFVKTGLPEELFFRGLIAGGSRAASPPSGQAWGRPSSSLSPTYLPPNYAGDVGYSACRLRRFALSGLGADQIRFDKRPVADSRLRQRCNLSECSDPNGHLSEKSGWLRFDIRVSRFSGTFQVARLFPSHGNKPEPRVV